VVVLLLLSWWSAAVCRQRHGEQRRTDAWRGRPIAGRRSAYLPETDDEEAGRQRPRPCHLIILPATAPPPRLTATMARRLKDSDPACEVTHASGDADSALVTRCVCPAIWREPAQAGEAQQQPAATP
jgi:hypothetical protein